jgi:hypothetical protein
MYTDEEGETHYVHPYSQGKTNRCIYQYTLFPMAWLIQQHVDLRDHLVQSDLRRGTCLEFEPCPFEEWLSVTENTQLSNMLQTFSLFIDLRGVPPDPYHVYT